MSLMLRSWEPWWRGGLIIPMDWLRGDTGETGDTINMLGWWWWWRGHPTVHEPLHLVVPGPQIGRLVSGSRAGRERPSPHTGDTGGSHRLPDSLLVRGPMPVRTGAATFFCFSAALLLLGVPRASSAGAGQSAEFGGPAASGPQGAGQGCTHCFNRHDRGLVLQTSAKLLSKYYCCYCCTKRSVPTCLMKTCPSFDVATPPVV